MTESRYPQARFYIYTGDSTTEDFGRDNALGQGPLLKGRLSPAAAGEVLRLADDLGEALLNVLRSGGVVRIVIEVRA